MRSGSRIFAASISASPRGTRSLIMIRNLIRFAALATVVGLGACEKQLATENQVQADTKKVLGTPADTEALLSTYYRRWSTGTYGSATATEAMANTLSLLTYSH